LPTCSSEIASKIEPRLASPRIIISMREEID
jgi:hypothetical protein